MLQNVEACEWLAGALRSLEVPNLDPIYANMRAVCILPFSFISVLFYFSLFFKDLWANVQTIEFSSLWCEPVITLMNFLAGYDVNLSCEMLIWSEITNICFYY